MPNNQTPNTQHPTSNEIAISLKNVSKYYKLYNNPKDRLKEALNRSNKTYHKKFYATKNLNLEIKKGEILGIVGKNGSGKSTLLKLITSVLVPDEGSVKVNGKISALLELGSGFNPEFTGMQNIFFYGTILGFTKKEMEKKLDNILAFADIGDFIAQPLKTYSSGMKSRLGFAVAVHIDPEILILDEVLAVGDVLFRRKCYAKMEEFFKGGKTIIYVSHDANSVNELCTRAVFLDAGTIILDSDAKTVTSYYQKYLFATDVNREKVRDEIKSLSEGKINTSEVSALPIKKEIDPTLFIKGFVSEPNRLNDHIAVFKDIMIYSDKNQTANQLTLKSKYIVKFKIVFKKEMKNVSLGLRVKTLKGVVISGINLKAYKNKTIPYVTKDSAYEVESMFDCLLLPDTYFLNLSCSDAEENSAGVDDAFMFKVLPSSVMQGGYVTLNQTLDVHNTENDNNIN